MAARVPPGRGGAVAEQPGAGPVPAAADGHGSSGDPLSCRDGTAGRRSDWEFFADARRPVHATGEYCLTMWPFPAEQTLRTVFPLLP